MVLYLAVRQPDRRYTMICEEVEYGDIAAYTEEHIVELTRRHAALLERQIRSRPGHWLWLHKRWKHTAHHEARRGDGVLSTEGSRS